jgi:Predicted phosphatase/phosphohexomutase
MNLNKVNMPGIGTLDGGSGLFELEACSDGCFKKGREGVERIVSTGDKKLELICFSDRTLAYVKSGMGYPAYYPVLPVNLERPVKAVLMDLDGTTVRSEEFWIWIIEKTVRSLLHDTNFHLRSEDLPHVSGHSVSEHLQYCITTYCPDKTVEEARTVYFSHTNYEMTEILEGRGKQGAFTPAPGIREFLLELKARKIKIGLVTSGLYEKAYPEILSAFQTLQMGDPRVFYDCVITAGSPLRKGSTGTLGELEAKPHPWLYAETCRVGLGIPFEDRGGVIGIEDSGAGVCSVRLAGYYTVGIGGGNIKESGTLELCNSFCDTFEEIRGLL